MVKKPHFYRDIFEAVGKPPVDIRDLTLTMVVESGLHEHRPAI